MKEKIIIVSGIRPTGKIHLGNYNSVIKNWIKLQDLYNCFFFIADIHALTTHFEKINNLSENTKLIIIELLALGINPKKCNIFIQSQIPEIFELHVLISMFVKISRLERIPSYKDLKNNNKTYGFLGYPILQAADVLSLNANYVPVGQDQIPHIELIKEITQKLNKFLFDNKSEFKFNEPNYLLYEYSKIIGIDGQKMSKSKDNAIFISDIDDILRKKINKFITDPNRVYRYQKGNPEICPIWFLHKIYNNEIEKKIIKESCENAKIGCTQCKDILFSIINKENKDISKRIEEYKKKDSYIKKIIEDGIEKARFEIKNNINQIKNIFKF